MIYYGYNRLENWLIDQRDKPLTFVDFILAPVLEDVPVSIQERMVPELKQESVVVSDRFVSGGYPGYGSPAIWLARKAIVKGVEALLGTKWYQINILPKSELPQ